ncbi:ATP-dependent dethiobiotin synthetase BioD [Steroidobacter cummioxidans]|uniref:ATP-dependent dethiobiotin synthetase BioD n=1 Tax=Steroidobacter cummioxidans TaxID=1803913 RepID=UPI00137B29B9|nr:dethiobiotin synthase [Steroidobacter cummioxidans]
MDSRPSLLMGVIGTNTEVGKTWVTAQLLATLKLRGSRVAARKPVQSYGPDEIDTDAARLAGASGEEVTDICPAHRWYPIALAPPMAANALGRGPVWISEIVDEICWPADVDIGFVETVGGVRSPVASDGDSLELLRRLDVDQMLLVADAKLGTINAVRLTLAAVTPTPTIVYLNRFNPDDPLHELNRRWLIEQDKLTVITDVHSLAVAIEDAFRNSGERTPKPRCCAR